MEKKRVFPPPLAAAEITAREKAPGVSPSSRLSPRARRGRPMPSRQERRWKREERIRQPDGRREKRKTKVRACLRDYSDWKGAGEREKERGNGSEREREGGRG